MKMLRTTFINLVSTRLIPSRLYGNYSGWPFNDAHLLNGRHFAGVFRAFAFLHLLPPRAPVMSTATVAALFNSTRGHLHWSVAIHSTGFRLPTSHLSAADHFAGLDVR